MQSVRVQDNARYIIYKITKVTIKGETSNVNTLASMIIYTNGFVTY